MTMATRYHLLTIDGVDASFVKCYSGEEFKLISMRFKNSLMGKLLSVWIECSFAEKIAVSHTLKFVATLKFSN